MAIAGNIAGPIVFLLIFNIIQFAIRFGLMNWSYKMGTQAIDALMDNMKAFTRAASILGVFVVGCLTVTMGGTQIALTIPNGSSESYVAHTAVVSNDEVSDFEVISKNDEGVTTSAWSTPRATPSRVSMPRATSRRRRYRPGQRHERDHLHGDGGDPGHR